MKHILSLFISFLISFSLLAQETNLAELSKRLENHVTLLSSDSLEGRGLGTQGKVIAKNYIASQFRDIGLIPYHENSYFQELDLRVGLVLVPGTNVIGFLNGSDTLLRDEFIVIGAHYDHLGFKMKDGEKIIYHGADDNASGVATVIELARYFASKPELLKRSIIFVAFDAEESGLFGAYKFINENDLLAHEQIKAMFSLDMVGMLTENKGIDLKGISSLNGGEKLALSIASSHDIRLKNTTVDIEAATDTWPFGEQGIPAIHAFTGMKSPYHKPEDTHERLDYEGMAIITVFMQALITELSASEELIPSKQFVRTGKPCALKWNAGITAGLGNSRHNYSDEYYNPKGIVAYNAGFFMQMHIGKKITLQPEFLFESDGSKSAEGIFRRQSVIIPVNLHFNIVNQYGGMIKAYPFAGVYFIHSFDGKNGDNELDFANTYHDQEWGLNFGIGLDVMKFQVKSTWQRGLTNLTRSADNEIYSSGWLISVGRKF